MTVFSLSLFTLLAAPRPRLSLKLVTQSKLSITYRINNGSVHITLRQLTSNCSFNGIGTPNVCCTGYESLDWSGVWASGASKPTSG